MSTTAPQNESVRKRRDACDRLRRRLGDSNAARVEGVLAEDPDLVDDLGPLVAELPRALDELRTTKGVPA